MQFQNKNFICVLSSDCSIRISIRCFECFEWVNSIMFVFNRDYFVSCISILIVSNISFLFQLFWSSCVLETTYFRINSSVFLPPSFPPSFSFSSFLPFIHSCIFSARDSTWGLLNDRQILCHWALSPKLPNLANFT